MKEVSGSDNLPEKNRRPFGCLIIKKKPESVSGGGSRKSFEGKERKRRLILSDSEESDDGLLSSSRRNLVSSNSGGGGSNVGKINVYNSFEREDEIDRKRSWLVEDSRIGKNRIGEVGNERKRSRVDGFEDDERGKKIVKKERLGERGSGIERNGSANAFFSSESPLPSGNYREFDSGHDRSAPLFRREHSDFDRSKRFPVDAKREMDYMDKHRIGMKEGTFRSVDHPRDKYGVSHGEQIRVPVPCKNGVLKVMINNRNKVGGPEKLYARREEGDNRNFSRIADISNWKSSHSPSFYSDDKTYQSRSVAVGEKNHKKSREKLRSVAVDEKNHLSPFKNFSAKERDNRKQVNDMFLRQESKDVSGSMEVKKKRDSRTEVNDVSLPHELKEVGSSREVKRERDNREEVSDTSSPQESKDVSSSKEVKKKAKKLKAEPHLLTVRKEGEVRRGFGTEKQLLREQIRKIILDAGWTIDFRPRRGRNYQDAVYKSPSGTEYWSIVKAYNALQKNFEDDGSEDKNNADASFFTPIPEEVLKKLTRQTKKKMEREMKMKNKADGGSRNAKETSIKQGKNKHAKLNMGSSVVGKKTNLYASHDAKSFKARATGSSIRPNTNDLKVSRKSAVPVEKADNEDGESPVDESSGASLKRLQKANGDKMVCFASDANSLEGGKRKHHPGRALLVRGSNCGKNLDGDDFVPYTGKRTVLSWLVDMETVRMSEKVQYMNKKRTKAMLEGWVTRDGIHCGCCSKILSVSKFEIHAASKLRQPFQNIFVEGGFSLLKCQLNAWDKLAKYIRDGFYSIHVDDDDPNDDTCGICGDGGDLICCDSCPSTFHQSCLAIQMLPPGDWHCPNCSCKYCNGVDGNIGQGEDTLSPLSTCSMCEEKYHQVCTLHSDSTPTNSNGSCTSFCGQMCKELFQHLQKLLGVKHELKDGFSWTLIQRSDLNFESSSRGLPQKTECNSKLAVALAVMNECFLPVIDRRSGINLIQNVLFNIGSNFSRLNYSGFYTAILERGDEIIAAASIRIHGTRLAEMPYIGTRHIYRRQGMCRRLLNAIERALCSVNVEKLVIPAISELTNTWTTVFGFKPLEERQRQGMRNLNMLVFPSTDMLQKPLLKHKLNEGDLSSGSDAQAIELKNNSDTVLVLANHCDKASLVAPGVLTRDQEVKHTSETNTGSDSLTNGLLGISSSEYDTSNVISNPLDGGGKPLPHAPREVSAPGSKFLHRTEECGTKLEDVMEKMSDSFFGPKYLTEDASNVFSIVMDVEDPYASKTKQERASVNTDLRSSGGSTYDTSNEISNPLDASSGSVHHAFREKSAIDTKVDCDIKLELDTEPISKLFVKESTPATKILDRGIDYAAKLELDTKPISDSSIERKYGREDAKHHDLKLNLSVAIELDLHSSAETSMECMTNTGGDYKNAEFGSSCHPTVGNPVRNDLDLNKVKVEKESVQVFHAVSDATLDENILMASKESTEQDFCQVRFQDLAPAHDPFTSDEIRTYRSSSVNTQQQDVECMDGFLGSGRNVSSHDSECTNQSFNTVSEYNDQGSSERTLPPHHDSHLSKDTQECASDATDTIVNACGVENEVAAVEHVSRSFQDSVDCTSEVIGSSMSLSTGCVEM